MREWGRSKDSWASEPAANSFSFQVPINTAATVPVVW